MRNKEKYYKALVENQGQLNEIDLGEESRMDEDETRLIIAELLAENSIEYVVNRNCNYRIKKTEKNGKRFR